MKKFVAEFAGTFGLVFCGTGAIVINQETGGAVGHIGIAITFGLIVIAMIYSYSHISGTHINPAVTLALWITGLFQRKNVLTYIIAQVSGAVTASLVLKLLFPLNPDLGATIPAGSRLQSFILEFVLTFILMMVILFSTSNTKTKDIAGIAIGITVLLEAWFAGPVSGASMNPARSFSPDLVRWNFDTTLVYIFSTISGAIAAGFLWKKFSGR